MAFYVLCDKNCKYESMTKEQILTAIEQAINEGKITNVDTGFVTKIKEKNRGAGLSFWVGTQAQYNAIENKSESCFYIITDDTTLEDINTTLAGQQQLINDVADFVSNTYNELQETKETLNNVTNVVNNTSYRKLFDGNKLSTNIGVVEGLENYGVIALRINGYFNNNSNTPVNRIHSFDVYLRTDFEVDYYEKTMVYKGNAFVPLIESVGDGARSSDTVIVEFTYSTEQKKFVSTSFLFAEYSQYSYKQDLYVENIYGVC